MVSLIKTDKHDGGRRLSASRTIEEEAVRPELSLIAYFVLLLVFYFANHVPGISTLPGFSVTPEQLVAAVDTGSLVRRLSFVSLGAFGALLLLIAKDRSVRPRNILALVVIAITAWMTISLVWAEHPELSARRLAVLLLMCLAAFGLSRHFDKRGLLILVLAICATNLVAGVIAELAVGTFSPLVPAYRFAGTLHPNAQGVNISMLLLAAVATRIPRHTLHRLAWIVLIVLAVAMLLLTKSRNAIASVGIAMTAYCLIVLTWRHRFGVALFSSSALAIVFLLLLANTIDPFLIDAVQLGRPDSDPATLTGRIDLWRLSLSYVMEKPLLGYGYESFWHPDHVITVSAQVGWGVLHAHSVYVDVLLSTGAVGLFLFVTLLVVATASILRDANRSHSTEAAGLVALLVYALVHSILETSLTSATFFGLVVMTTIAMHSFPRFRKYPDRHRRSHSDKRVSQRMPNSGFPGR